MAKVHLIEYTGKGRSDQKWHAADVLIFTKNTRLNMDPAGFEAIAGWTEERKTAELAYMSTTLPSSWEFVDLTFLVQGVTRAIAQQMTRTRNASYAMQAQRVVNIAEANVRDPFEDRPELSDIFKNGVTLAKDTYTELVDGGAKLEEARAIMPIHTECNLCVKYNMRALTELARKRDSIRVQGEYVDIVAQMRSLVIETWPWAAPFFQHPNEAAINILKDIVKELALEVKPGEGIGWRMAKAIDLIKNG